MLATLQARRSGAVPRQKPGMRILENLIDRRV
jgi:hypothetical protein